jgi:hypothetical protein
MSTPITRLLIPTTINLLAIASSTCYLRSHLTYNLEEQEARLDEIEGTLRGHIGLIEDALDRIEGKKNANKQEELYSGRARMGKSEDIFGYLLYLVQK